MGVYGKEGMQVVDRKGRPIKIGDCVFTKEPFERGSQQGNVEHIIYSDAEAKEAGVRNAPAVIYHDQHGHRVVHSPREVQVQDFFGPE